MLVQRICNLLSQKHFVLVRFEKRAKQHIFASELLSFYRFSLNTKSKSANLDLFWFWLYDCIFEMGEVGLFSESTVCSRLRLLKMVLERGSSSNLSTSSLVRLRISEIPRAAFRRSSFLFKCSSSSCNLSRLDVLAFKASFVFRWSIVSLSSRSLK